MARTTFIYALCEPGTRTVRYIGKADSLKKRLREHLSHSIKAKSHLGAWLRSLKGLKPVQIILCQMDSEVWQEIETSYISGARALGMNLVNGTEGGEGGPSLCGPQHPNFGKSPSAETVEKRRKALLGKKLPPFSEQHRKRIGDAQRGKKRPMSLETREKIGAAQRGIPKGPLSSETRAKMASSQKLRRRSERGLQ